jgi:hypothetical protein
MTGEYASRLRRRGRVVRAAALTAGGETILVREGNA